MDTVIVNQQSIFVCENRDELSRSLAEMFVNLANEAVKRQDRFTVALSGGSTPKSLYSLLAQPEYSTRVPWAKTHLFWGDERCVTHDSPESNYKMVRESLLSKIQIPADHVHPTTGQDIEPDRAARDYEEVLKLVFQISGEAIPRFDLILLGLGPDGHTASLFPGSEALKESKRLVVANYVEKFKSDRITFTLSLLNSAAHVIFMVSGEDKKEILPQVLQSGQAAYPAQLVRPKDGKLEWYVDQVAMEKVNRPALAGP